LHDWLKNGWLTEHSTSSEEIKDLFDAVDRDLTDCQLPGLSPDWRLHIAYNATLLMAAAALAAAGYRPTRESHQYRLIQSLARTIKADPILITRFDVFRKKSNISGYEPTGVISDHEVMAMIDLVSQLRSEVTKWLQANYPDLVKQ
jgi:hypothetical protein